MRGLRTWHTILFHPLPSPSRHVSPLSSQEQKARALLEQAKEGTRRLMRAPPGFTVRSFTQVHARVVACSGCEHGAWAWTCTRPWTHRRHARAGGLALAGKSLRRQGAQGVPGTDARIVPSLPSIHMLTPLCRHIRRCARRIRRLRRHSSQPSSWRRVPQRICGHSRS